MGGSFVILPFFGDWHCGHLRPGDALLQFVNIAHCKLQVKGELEWTVGKWAGVPVRPGIAHWERREREGKEGGGPSSGAVQGEGNRASVVEGDEKIEESIRAVSLSQEGEKVAMATQESLKPEEESQVKTGQFKNLGDSKYSPER